MTDLHPSVLAWQEARDYTAIGNLGEHIAPWVPEDSSATKSRDEPRIAIDPDGRLVIINAKTVVSGRRPAVDTTAQPRPTTLRRAVRDAPRRNPLPTRIPSSRLTKTIGTPRPLQDVQIELAGHPVTATQQLTDEARITTKPGSSWTH